MGEDTGIQFGNVACAYYIQQRRKNVLHVQQDRSGNVPRGDMKAAKTEGEPHCTWPMSNNASESPKRDGKGHRSKLFKSRSRHPPTWTIWTLIRSVGSPLLTLVIHGRYLKSCSRNCKRSPVISTCLLHRQLPYSTNFDNSCSVPDVQMSNQVSVRTFSSYFSLHAIHRPATWRRCLQIELFLLDHKTCGWIIDFDG